MHVENFYIQSGKIYSTGLKLTRRIAKTLLIRNKNDVIRLWHEGCFSQIEWAPDIKDGPIDYANHNRGNRT